MELPPSLVIKCDIFSTRSFHFSAFLFLYVPRSFKSLSSYFLEVSLYSLFRLLPPILHFSRDGVQLRCWNCPQQWTIRFEWDLGRASFRHWMKCSLSVLSTRSLTQIWYGLPDAFFQIGMGKIIINDRTNSLFYLSLFLASPIFYYHHIVSCQCNVFCINGGYSFSEMCCAAYFHALSRSDFCRNVSSTPVLPHSLLKDFALQL